MHYAQNNSDANAQALLANVALGEMSEPTLICDIMQYGLITIGPDTSGYEAIRLLVEKDISGLPVIDDTRLVGMISEKDILKMVVQSDLIPGMASDFMTTDVVTCDESTSILGVCACLSRHSFRHIPVMRGGKVVGIISRSDLIRAYQESFRPEDRSVETAADASRPVARDIMTCGLLTVTPQTSIYRAMQMLASHEITGLPVVDNALGLLGILSEKDIIDLLSSSRTSPTTVGQVMTTDVVAFQEGDCLMDICDCLATSDFRRVPILNGDRLVGIVSRRDLIVFLLKNRSFLRSHRA